MQRNKTLIGIGLVEGFLQRSCQVVRVSLNSSKTDCNAAYRFVILSTAKDLSTPRIQILRCAQNDKVRKPINYNSQVRNKTWQPASPRKP